MRKLPRVLIVEDEPAIAELIAVNLRHNGFQPFWAEDGDSAQRELDAVLPDVILLDLIDERFLQIQGLLAAMPLTLADGLAKDMVRLKRMKTLLSTTAANIAPMQGEYLGGNVPHLIFVGRRGQPFFWSPFENDAGNHNVAICGKSGSGKSVMIKCIIGLEVPDSGTILIMNHDISSLKQKEMSNLSS